MTLSQHSFRIGKSGSIEVDYFILVNNEVKQINSFEEWKERKMTHEIDRIVKKTQVNEHIEVSTIFDGVGSDRFESVIFDKNNGDFDQDCINSYTYNEALLAHEKQLNKVRKKE